MDKPPADQPVIPRYKPYYHEVQKGKTYLWCACGRSQHQPFCDQSHVGTAFSPVRYVAAADEEVLFCGCKHTTERPFCDGAHNNLKATYDLDDPDSPANRAVPTVGAGADAKARLDGHCLVCRMPDLDLMQRGTLSFATVVTSADGAIYQSQFFLRLAAGESPVMSLGGEAILLITRGSGSINIGGRRFPVGLHDGVYVREGEAIQIGHSDGETPVEVFVTVSPGTEVIDWLPAMPGSFDHACPKRVVCVDYEVRHSMGDRFFQMLVDNRIGSRVITQFIGEIPLSKALPHRHLYEETLVVLRGSGCMWTETKKTPVSAGDAIFLPRKQEHSLQCTDPAGMLIGAVICPGDNPSINY